MKSVNMQGLLLRFSRLAITLVMVALGLGALWMLYSYYTFAPQTRDGKIRADVVPLATDVSGSVTEVLVQDNQHVRAGQILFRIDKARLRNNVDQAAAAVANARATLAAAKRENKRYQALDGVVPAQEQDIRRSTAEEAEAQLQQALASLDLAKINLVRSDVLAPVNGIVTNFSLRPGAYAIAGQAIMALVDSDSFYVAGYFEETKLPRIHSGDPVSIRVMGDKRILHGHVESIAAGIADRERVATSGTLLANVNPTFSWVRLAQRVPVRIAIDSVPVGFDLIAGRTVTVSVETPVKPESRQ